MDCVSHSNYIWRKFKQVLLLLNTFLKFSDLIKARFTFIEIILICVDTLYFIIISELIVTLFANLRFFNLSQLGFDCQISLVLYLLFLISLLIKWAFSTYLVKYSCSISICRSSIINRSLLLHQDLIIITLYRCLIFVMLWSLNWSLNAHDSRTLQYISLIIQLILGAFI